MFYKAKVAVCSETRTKHINAMWAPRRIFECGAWWYVKLPLGLKRLNSVMKGIILVSETPKLLQTNSCNGATAIRNGSHSAATLSNPDSWQILRPPTATADIRSRPAGKSLRPSSRHDGQHTTFPGTVSHQFQTRTRGFFSYTVRMVSNDAPPSYCLWCDNDWCSCEGTAFDESVVLWR
jgi:hypothetical protein